MGRCLGLSSDVVGIHAGGGPRAAAFFYPSTGPTDPLRRAYVFYAGPADAPVPELVQELAAAGKLRQSVVDATADFEEQGPALESVSPVTGLRVRPIVYRHERKVLPVAIYEPSRTTGTSSTGRATPNAAARSRRKASPAGCIPACCLRRTPTTRFR